MKTAKQYIDSLRSINHEIQLFDQRVKGPVDQPIIRRTVSCLAATYELAHMATELEATRFFTGVLTRRGQMRGQPGVFRNRAIQAEVIVPVPRLVPEHITGKGKAT